MMEHTPLVITIITRSLYPLALNIALLNKIVGGEFCGIAFNEVLILHERIDFREFAAFCWRVFQPETRVIWEMQLGREGKKEIDKLVRGRGSDGSL